MAEDNTKLGFSYSVALHLGVAIAAIVSVFVSSLWRDDDIEPPQPFELVEPPPEQPAPETLAPEPSSQILQPKVDKIDPLDLPQPQPEPEPEPQPEPQPAEPAPKPQPKPTPKPTPKPKPKKVSYADFIKENPKVNRHTQTRTAPRKPVVAPKINAVTTAIQNIATNKSTNYQNSAAFANAKQAYLQLIHFTAKRNWIAPESTAGMSFSARIAFNLSKSGGISNVRIIQSSGNADFDKSVIAVFNNITLPPPPEGLGETITLTFKTEI